MDREKEREVSSLDLRFFVKEWEFLKGGFIRKVYHSGDSENWKVVFEVFVPQKGTFYLNVYPKWISLERSKEQLGEKPSGFCMLLRKNLSGKRIDGIDQHGFDRILEISVGGLRLVFEFVPPGNIILIDSQNIIIGALKTKKWKDREIRARSNYLYPPGRQDPFSMGFEEFSRFFCSEKKAVAVLASELGFGSAYANKIFSESDISTEKPAKELKEEEIRLIFEKIRTVEKIQSAPPKTEKNQEKDRLEIIELQRKEALEKWKEAERAARERADAIYRKFDTVEALLEKFSKKEGMGFEPIMKREGLHITVNLDGVDVTLDLRKSAQENAAYYYEQAKKARRKIKGLEQSMEKPLKERVGIDREPIEEKKGWYEKFRWFVSSDGFLVVAGKSAEQNELLLKNYAEPEEWCFHADVKGAAFVVVNSGKNEPPEQTKKEAAEFAAASSKAWTRGSGSVDVFSVQRKSLSKSPPTGMFLPKGSFMVYGKRVWYRNVPLRMAVGVDQKGRVVSGPESSVSKVSKYVVVIVPGEKRASELAREIKSEFIKKARVEDAESIQRLSLEEIERHIPFGKGELMQ
ncbi:MAG: NFACT family protein [Candidatus Aenigmatarchaeota archaeon]